MWKWLRKLFGIASEESSSAKIVGSGKVEVRVPAPQTDLLMRVEKLEARVGALEDQRPFYE